MPALSHNRGTTMKVLKKYSSLLLALICSLVLCMPVYAKDNDVYVHDYFQYTVSDESVTIINYYGKDSEVTVPARIAGNPVNTIAAGAFSENTDVKKVNLPDSIMTIEEKAFSGTQTVVYNSNTDNPKKPSDSETDQKNNGNNSGNTNSNSGSQTSDTNQSGTKAGSTESGNSAASNSNSASTDGTKGNTGKSIEKTTGNSNNQTSENPVQNTDGSNAGIDFQEADLTELPDSTLDESATTATDNDGNTNAKAGESDQSSGRIYIPILIVVIVAGIVAFFIFKSKQKK